MKPTLLSLAAVFLALCAPSAVLADPPDLDVAELQRGDLEAELNAWRGDSAWTVRPELTVGLSDRVALEFQADFSRERRGAARWREVSAQLMVGLSADGLYGLAAEVGYEPPEEGRAFEVFAYGTHKAGPWRLDANLGLGRSEGESSWSYAWLLQRELGQNWSAGLEGGGEIPLRGPGAEQVVGPAFTVNLPGRPLALRIGYLFGLNGQGDLARIGFELDL